MEDKTKHNSNKTDSSFHKISLTYPRWLAEMFQAAISDNCKTLDEKEVVNLMQHLNNNITTNRIQTKLKVRIHPRY